LIFVSVVLDFDWFLQDYYKEVVIYQM